MARDRCPLCLIPRNGMASVEDYAKGRAAWWIGYGPCYECTNTLNRLDGKSKRSRSINEERRSA